MKFKLASGAPVWGGVLLAVAATALTIRGLTPDYARVRAGRTDAGYLQSGDCRKCHAMNYETWRQTFHRTMTQEVESEAILGDFEHNNTITYQGIRAEMVREGGRYWMKLTDAAGQKQQLEIVRTVGSRRIQQYLTKSGSAWVRLPIAYDIVHGRWMHLNGSFFFPDGSDYKQHVAEWNVNCVFCHNVKAQPHLDWIDKSWKTEVAELGIACGACHGPAGEHAAAALSPVTRYRWHLKDAGSPPLSVVNPARLDSDRSAMICGHCHGQRIPDPPHLIRAMMRADPYDPGKNLRDFYKPVQREDKVETVSFAPRFWQDGSPRLTAYEYQGLTRSKCFQAGKPGARITCISCHEMHGGDPRGQLTQKMKTNAACNQCHEQFAKPAQLVEHTKHGAGSTGSLCYNCHMPQIVYGVMSAHRTHDITIPNPEETVRFDKPNACNQCHLDWSVNRTIAETQRLWPKKAFAASKPGPARFDEPEGQRALFQGDAVMRALTAAAMLPTTDITAPLMLEAMQDRYPIVRYFAANALAAQYPALPKPDYLAPADVRNETLRMWYPRWTPEALQAAKDARERLSAGRAEVDVEVGE